MSERNELFETNAGEPVGVVYNVQADDLAVFIKDYLAGAGITRIERVAFAIDNDGKVKGFLFINNASDAIDGQESRVPARLRNRIEGSSEISFKSIAKDALMPVCGRKISCGRARELNNNVFVRLNPFRCLGLYLKANPKKHDIRILEAANTMDNRQIITVLKQDASTIRGGYTNNSGDKYDKFMRHYGGNRG